MKTYFSSCSLVDVDDDEITTQIRLSKPRFQKRSANTANQYPELIKVAFSVEHHNFSYVAEKYVVAYKCKRPEADPFKSSDIFYCIR